ncbi:retron system putative HNH endonuclease [Paracoccus rhizosphaerae]|uniref:Retron system putative HNH endonuclease n=1 Tax=Paracoccus rhizosphaerae TaxID=1133347 RepID=A0ABV6CHD3_9RHOB|nr:retron system putative HNH endonuclease [Paracoccus rhizosphaerae]
MRQISKSAPPPELTEWIAANRNGPNCNYDSIGGDLRQIIRQALVSEQGGLCAYTGCKIDVDTCHIEHLKPQKHCSALEDVAYSNLAAAVPKPNTGIKFPYGAHLKDNWPSPDESTLFVSPLSIGCSARFSFSFSGKISASNVTDSAADETIKRLGLNHNTLIKFRHAAIKGTIKLRGRDLDVKTARRRLEDLQQKERTSNELEAFSVALIDALKKHIARLKKIREKKK